MKNIKRKIIVFCITMLLTITITPLTSLISNADWDVSDGHKMHFPQLPNQNGWDVFSSGEYICADDWQCSESGYIKDIHFWGSWQNDEIGIIRSFDVYIYSDIPVGPDHPYSQPGEQLWYRQITDFRVRQAFRGDQGWYEPVQEYWIVDDHEECYQYNIFLDRDDWFYQEEDTIYWLAIHANVMGDEKWGWKSSSNHWNDDGCWNYFDSSGEWYELWEPPYDPVNNDYVAVMGPGNDLLQGGGSGWEERWYFYPETNWWNIWFYNAPYDQNRMKRVDIIASAEPLEPGVPGILTFAINWATPEWSSQGNQFPPIPPIENEELFIRRAIMFEGPIEDRMDLIYTYYIREYNPEWVSIDIMGEMFNLVGEITHTCYTSLDLAFVINGEYGMPDIDIDKKVSIDNRVTWNDEVEADVGDTVRFKLTVENTGETDLTNVKVIDTLPSCLEYADNADPVEPSISGNELTWTYILFPPGLTREIEFDAVVIRSGENINEAEATSNEQVRDNDSATVNVGLPVPDLDCEGALSWARIQPGATVSGTIYVKNIGESGSKLNWRICDEPYWGTWSFSPEFGTDLTPSNGNKAISVSVVAPNEQNQEFTGNVKICNEDDTTDYCTIQVSLATPKVRPFNPIQWFLSNHACLYHIFQHLLF